MQTAEQDREAVGFVWQCRRASATFRRPAPMVPGVQLCSLPCRTDEGFTMSSRLAAISGIFLVLGTSAIASAEHLWTRFAPAEKVASDPAGDYSLRETHGPWLVMATSFNGEGAADQARDLVIELRQRYNLPAYHYHLKFEHQADDVGRGIDRYGDRIRRRYQTSQSEEHAVLVGDFPSIDDTSAQERLHEIKHLRPTALEKAFLETSQSLAREREYLRRITGDKSPGPMEKAFMTRNPLLPEGYFQPNMVDEFVANMNKGVTHSLLECQGKYTVQIATFRGRSELQGAFKTGKTHGRAKKDKVDPLLEAAEKAHDLTVFLRAKGWPAFEFHDRTESWVTVGSFDKVIEQSAAGQQVPTRNVEIVFKTFGAAFTSPQDLTPSLSQGAPKVDPNAVRQQFVNLFNNEHGQVAGGLQPKFVQINRGTPDNPDVKVIPLDIHPQVIEVPKRSVSSSYVWNR
jgi:hypothetical protein